MFDQNDSKRPDSAGRFVMIWSLACGGFMFVLGLLAAAKNGWDNDLLSILVAVPLLTAVGVGVGRFMQFLEQSAKNRTENKTENRRTDSTTYRVSNYVNGNVFECAKCGQQELLPKGVTPSRCSSCDRPFTGFS